VRADGGSTYDNPTKEGTCSHSSVVHDSLPDFSAQMKAKRFLRHVCDGFSATVQRYEKMPEPPNDSDIFYDLSRKFRDLVD